MSVVCTPSTACTIRCTKAVAQSDPELYKIKAAKFKKYKKERKKKKKADQPKKAKNK